MAVSIAILEQGAGGADPFNTGSITWSGGVGVIFVASAYGSAGSVTHAATKSGDTWTSQADVDYGSRRGLCMLTNTSPSNGVIAINPNGTGSYQDSFYFVCEMSGSDDAVPGNIDTDGSATGETGPQTVSLTDTIDAGDLAIFCGACEQSTQNHDVDGITQVGTDQTSSNTRSGLVGQTTSDTTPGHTWTGSASNAAIACVFNVAPAGGGGYTSALTLTGVG